MIEKIICNDCNVGIDSSFFSYEPLTKKTSMPEMLGNKFKTMVI